jgi:7-cyano-7-deazaguanine synthase
MDSTFAAFWANNHPNLTPTIAVFYNYGQKGAGFEWKAAKEVADILKMRAVYYDVSALAPHLSGAIMAGQSLPEDPQQEDEHGNAVTFVPGRNLIHLALLSSLLYTTNIKNVVGGWNAVDVDYPDCSEGFLNAMGATMSLALGSVERPIHIHAPAIHLTKDEIVAKGNTWFIPWRTTRSCYSDDYHACGVCDSCLVRARAFWVNDMQDPAFRGLGHWRQVIDMLFHKGYLDPAHRQEKGE